MEFAHINRFLQPPKISAEFGYLLLFLFPVGLHLYLNWALIQQGIFPEGDWATLSIMTRRALSFDQFLGNYSRFGWSHPGPFMFYLIGMLSLLFKRFASPEMVAVFCYQVVFFYMAYRMLISANGLFAGLILVGTVWLIYVGMVRIYPAELFRTLFFNYWAPLLTMFPMLFFLTAAAAAASGRSSALLPLAFSASILPQLHIGTSFHAAIFFVVGLGCWIVLDVKRNGPDFFQRHLIVTLTAAGIVFIIWLLPFYEAAVNGGGNLLDIFKFFFAGEAGAAVAPSFTQAIQYLLSFYAVPLQILLMLGGLAPKINSPLLTLAVIGACFVVCMAAFRNVDIKQKIFCVFPWIFFLVSIPSIMKIRGEMYPYLMYWQFANVALLYTVVLSSLYHLIAGLPLKAKNTAIIRRCGSILALVFFIGIVNLLSTMPPVAFGSDLPQREFFTVLKRLIGKTGDQVRLSSGDHSTWPYVAGVLNASVAADLPVCVPDSWLWVYGKLSKCRDRNVNKELIFFDNLDNTKLKKFLAGRDGIILKFENPAFKARYLLAAGFEASLPKAAIFVNGHTRVSVLKELH